MKVCPIVEGFGEVESLPILLRRRFMNLEVLRPIRVSRDKFVNSEQEFSRAVSLGIGKAATGGATLILIDSDDRCPVELSAFLRERINRLFPNSRVSVVVANQEFESWFIAGIDSLRGFRGIPNEIDLHPDPEQVRGAKEWIGSHIGRYSSRIDQPAFAARISFESASRSRSFRKLLKEIDKIGNQND